MKTQAVDIVNISLAVHCSEFELKFTHEPDKVSFSHRRYRRIIGARGSGPLAAHLAPVVEPGASYYERGTTESPQAAQTLDPGGYQETRMRTIFTTDQIHERDRFDYWHEAARHGIIDHDANPVCRRLFRAELHSGTVGANDLVLFKNSDMSVSRTNWHIAHGTTDEIFVCRQFGGRMLLEQDGRQVRLESGGVALLNPSVPYEAQFEGGSELLVFKVRREALESRLGGARELMARALPETPDAQLTSAYLGLLPLHTDGLSSAVEECIEPHILDLIALSFGKLPQGSVAPSSSSRSLVRTKVRAAVEANLWNPRFEPGAAAQAAGVSVRYANAVLAEEGTSLMQLIQNRRLDRCRQALADPTQAHRKISEIAYGWGFSDMSHFGRRFKAAYGFSPREFRRHAQTG
jgi:AraC family transcriptional regulator, positive regulator of tynA and feaB